MASLVEGRYTGKLFFLEPGSFEIHKRIRLPKYLADGDYKVDLHLHEPFVQDFIIAKSCQSLHVVGFYDLYALPILLKEEGFIGLQSE